MRSWLESCLAGSSVWGFRKPAVMRLRDRGPVRRNRSSTNHRMSRRLAEEAGVLWVDANRLLLRDDDWIPLPKDVGELDSICLAGACRNMPVV